MKSSEEAQMLKSIRSRVSPATVIASIALFAALGGGYATAFSGSGTLQKAATDGVSAFPTYQTARTLNGFGTLQVSCKGGADAVTYRLNNTTGSFIDLRVLNKKNGGNSSETVPSGTNSATYDADAAAGEMEFHLSKPSAGNKAGVMIWATNRLGADPCGSNQVRTLALNTQE